VSLYGDALSLVRSIVLIDERVKSLSDKVDRIAVHLDHLFTRQMTRKRVPKGPTE